MTRSVLWDSSAILALLDADDAGGLTVVRVLPDEEQRARELLARYTDKDWTLCDAVSFALLDARRIRRAFTFDHHFQQYGRVEVLGLPQEATL